MWNVDCDVPNPNPHSLLSQPKAVFGASNGISFKPPTRVDLTTENDTNESKLLNGVTSGSTLPSVIPFISIFNVYALIFYLVTKKFQNFKGRV